jgi:4-carboxymuconolactone decarboxylase
MTERLRPLVPYELDASQAEVYAAIVGGPRGGAAVPLTDDAGALTGPFNAMLYAPRIGIVLQELGAALRYRTSLDARTREIAILVVAAHWQSRFEQYTHEAVGRQCGLTEAEIEALRQGEPLTLPDQHEQAVYDVVRALVVERDLDDDAFTAARQALGEATLVELSTLVGYYALLALQLRVFRVAAPA